MNIFQLPAQLLPDAHPELPRAALFKRPPGYGPGCMSVEEAEFIYSLVRLVKPSHALETGCEGGLTTVAIARALQDNDLGILYTVENDDRWIAHTRTNLHAMNLASRVLLARSDSLKFIEGCDRSQNGFDFALLDSSIPTRLLEFDALMRNDLLNAGAWVALHDTNPAHPMRGGAELFPAFVARQPYASRVRFLELPSPRGLLIARIDP